MAAAVAMLKRNSVFGTFTNEQCLECFFLYTSAAMHKFYSAECKPSLFSVRPCDLPVAWSDQETLPAI
jgi:hypothetical protein